MKYVKRESAIEAMKIPSRDDFTHWAPFVAWCLDNNVKLIKGLTSVDEGSDEVPEVVYFESYQLDDHILVAGNYLVVEGLSAYSSRPEQVEAAEFEAKYLAVTPLLL